MAEGEREREAGGLGCDSANGWTACRSAEIELELLSFRRRSKWDNRSGNARSTDKNLRPALFFLFLFHSAFSETKCRHRAL